MEEVRKVPKMRFKEFEGEWVEKKLGEVAEVIGGGTPSTTIQEYWNGDIPWITPKDISNNLNKYVSNGVRNISILGVKKSNIKILPKNTILFTSRAPIGYVSIANCEISTNQGFQNFLCKENIFNYNFGYYIIKYNIKDQFKNIEVGSTFKEVYGKDLKALSILLPTLPEQTKIANFLTLVDDKIELEQQKLDNYTQYKKGMLQQIFNKTLRFKDDDGREFGEWVEVKFNKLINQIIDNRGKTPPISLIGTPLLEVNSIGKLKPDYMKVKKFINNETYSSWFRNHIEENDLLITTVGSIGLVSISDKNKICIAQNIVGIRLNNLCYPKFFYYLLNISENKIKINSIKMNAVQPSIKITEFIKLPILLPTLPEQTKIANFLTLIDDKLELQQQKVAQLNLYKKALLQQMFV